MGLAQKNLARGWVIISIPQMVRPSTHLDIEWLGPGVCRPERPGDRGCAPCPDEQAGAAAAAIRHTDLDKNSVFHIETVRPGKKGVTEFLNKGKRHLCGKLVLSFS